MDRLNIPVPKTPMNSRWWLTAVAAGLVAAGAIGGGLISRHIGAQAMQKEGGETTTTQTVAPHADLHAAAAKPLCAQCGTVETVHSETRKGQASGVGAVAGGVLGGLVGNQFGKGDGRKAMTVVGAVGGGLAGNEIEKNRKSHTVYVVQVRMADGSLRRFTQGSPLTVGQTVRVDGQALQVLNAPQPG